ncbi:MAG: 30S ribosomal protein S15 [Thermoprotei archaeon]|nr:30S ribosomal protein S15 [TACK group archaeon]
MKKNHRKGKSQSKRPLGQLQLVEGNPVTPEELKEKIVSMRKQGLSKALIGQKLRDEEGIPSVKRILGKSLTEALKEEGEKEVVPEDLANLISKKQRIQNHLEQHPKDNDSKKGLVRTDSKIRRLMKYYKREGILPQNWQPS